MSAKPSTAPLCTASGGAQSIEPDVWITDPRRKKCNACGQDAPYRVRVSDLPPWGRVGPHRTDGSPARWSDVPNR
jgi:hypothetical protein